MTNAYRDVAIVSTMHDEVTYKGTKNAYDS